MEDYYSVLGVKKSATPAEIKDSYMKLVRKYHPDSVHNRKLSASQKKEVEDKMKKVNEAFSVLSDSTKRKQYDSGGFDSSGSGQNWSNFDFSQGFQFNEGIDLGDFASMFGFDGGFGSSGISQKGEDIQHQKIITLEESFREFPMKIEYEIRELCSSCFCKSCGGSGQKTSSAFGFLSFSRKCNECDGRGVIGSLKNCKICKNGFVTKKKIADIVIPAGVKNGWNIKFTGLGHGGIKQYGDLLILVQVKPHKFFSYAEGEKDNANLKIEVEISIIDWLMGKTVAITGIDGRELSFQIEGNDISKPLVLKHEGMKKFNQNSRGDLLVYLKLLHTKLTPAQKQSISSILR